MTRRFVLEFDISEQLDENGHIEEISRVLLQANDSSRYAIWGYVGKLRDSNGNTIGHFKIVESDYRGGKFTAEQVSRMRSVGMGLCSMVEDMAVTPAARGQVNAWRAIFSETAERYAKQSADMAKAIRRDWENKEFREAETAESEGSNG